MDSVSMFKSMKEKDLTSSNIVKGNNIDARSGATRTNLKDYAVSGAVYTCYSLWHTVYGSTRTKILQIQNAYINENYVKKLIDSRIISNLLFVIKLMEANNKLALRFENDIIYLLFDKQMQGADFYLFEKKTVQYFESGGLIDCNLQVKMANYWLQTNGLISSRIIWTFLNAYSVCDEACIILLNGMLNNVKSRVNFGLISHAIKPDNLKNKKIYDAVIKFSISENIYVSNAAKKLLY
jgi:hypothetical protein